MKTIIIKADGKCVKTAVQFLKKGEIIIYPTETSYGIGAGIDNKKALEKIYEIKQRPIEKQLIYLVSSLEMAKKYAFLTEDHEKLINTFMPGPLTIVAKGKKNNIDEFAFRISSNILANEIVKAFGRPIASTSANFTGDPPNYKIKDIIALFNGKAALIIDTGDIPPAQPSTVVDLFDGMNIRREGIISKQQITNALQA